MNSIKEGYKQTEIGVIPEDWEVRYVKSIFRELSIKNHPNEKLLLASQSQ